MLVTCMTQFRVETSGVFSAVFLGLFPVFLPFFHFLFHVNLDALTVKLVTAIPYAKVKSSKNGHSYKV